MYEAGAIAISIVTGPTPSIVVTGVIVTVKVFFPNHFDIGASTLMPPSVLLAVKCPSETATFQSMFALTFISFAPPL